LIAPKAFRSNKTELPEKTPMQMRARLEALIEEMLDGQIMLDEAVAEFEKLYIQKALARHKEHLSRTAGILGIHRNTLSKRVAAYRKQERAANRIAKRHTPRS
jgi:DNA-binding NtrC family response regulator